MESDNNNITIEKFLGEGSTSNVYLCTYNNKKYAIKLLKDIPIAKTSFIQETKSLNEIVHPNITNIIRSGISKLYYNDKIIDNPYILLELAEKGELFNYIFYPKKGFSEPESRFIFKQILNAVKACHDKNIAHLDIKTENIMLDSNWKIKLADFGLSRITEDKDSLVNSFFGTETFLAPEVVSIPKKAYDPFKADIFSLGVTLFIIMTGNPPFKSARKFDIHYQYYIKKKEDLFWKIIKKNNSIVHEFSDDTYDLFNKMFESEPKKRISIDELLNHPWMTKETATEEEMNKEFILREEIVNEKRNQNINVVDIEQKLSKMTIDIYENLEHSN